MKQKKTETNHQVVCIGRPDFSMMGRTEKETFCKELLRLILSAHKEKSPPKKQG